MSLFRRFFHPSRRELDVIRAYAEWAPSYPAYAHNALMRAEEKAMLDLLLDARGKIALDLACGTGRYARILRARGAKYVTGVDISSDMLMRADKLNADFVLSNLTRLPFANDFFDLIVCGLAIGHVENLRSAIGEISRTLLGGGTLLYSDFHPLGYLAGWQRQFNGRNGTRYTVEHYVHLYSDHDAACRAADLKITGIREPIIGRDIAEPFPGSNELYRRWNGWPAALVIRAEKI